MDMGKYSLICLFFFQFHNPIFAQLNDSFSDNDFSNNPAWWGDTAQFFVNDRQQLQSRSTQPNAIFYVATASKMVRGTEWQFWCQLQFNTSSVNYVDVFLVSQDSNLLSASNRGYFVRIGSSSDDISLNRLDAQSVPTQLIVSQAGLTNRANSVFGVRVSCDEQGMWTLQYDEGAQGLFTPVGTRRDLTYTTSAAFGIAIHQSTSSFFGKHVFDDFRIQRFVPDTLAPVLDSLTVIDKTTLRLLFNEPMQEAAAVATFNYSVAGVGMPAKAVLLAPNLVELNFAHPFENRKQYDLLLKDLQDLSGNELPVQTRSFTYFLPSRYDVVISELLLDASPSAGLPPGPFIELLNRTGHPVYVGGWQLKAGNERAYLPAVTLPPAGYFIVCAPEHASAYQAYGPVIAVDNFPGLPQRGGLAALYDAAGQTMHAVNYSPDQIENAVKREGGWSLELIDVEKACDDRNNWLESVAAKGGTPGARNSVAGVLPDLPPEHRFAYQKDSVLTLVFATVIDSGKAVEPARYPGIGFSRAEVVPPLFQEVRLHGVIQAPGTIHETVLPAMVGCYGVVARVPLKYGFLQSALPGDVIVNEVLFNPPPLGTDYVELYNRSKKVIDAAQLRLANRNAAGEISGLTGLNDSVRPFYSGEYLLLSANPRQVAATYLIQNPQALATVARFPSYPNEAGHVVLLTRSGDLLEEVAYAEAWHHPLVKDPKGVSLERIDAQAPVSAANFQSAAANAGYGTPGYANSQVRQPQPFDGDIRVEPKVFSPDGDGTDDFVLIRYRFPVSGGLSDVKIFDASGRLVRHLEKNSLTGTEGFFKWDGLDEQQRPLPQGVYIVFTRAHHPSGAVREFKQTVVLGRRAR